MARVKSIEVKKKAPAVVEIAEGKKKRKRKPGFKVKQEIRRLQRSGDLLLPKTTFHRMVRSIAHCVMGDKLKQLRFTESAMDAMQEDTEDTQTKMFQAMDMLAHHAGRSTIDERDMKMMKRLFTRFGPILSAVFRPGMPELKSQEELYAVIKDMLHQPVGDITSRSDLPLRESLEMHIMDFTRDPARTKEELMKFMSAAALPNVERMTMHDIRRDAYLNLIYK